MNTVYYQSQMLVSFYNKTVAIKELRYNVPRYYCFHHSNVLVDQLIYTKRY